jgi:Spy/CpxP family protein refolding chaperone
MTKRTIVAALATLVLAGSAWAQMPPGKWWRRHEVAQRLGLTAEQKTRLDTVFRDAAGELIDWKADVEKANIALRYELDQPQINRQNLQRLAARLSEARGKLFEREVLMLADMRSVLNDEQWSQLRAHLDRPPDRRRPM